MKKILILVVLSFCIQIIIFPQQRVILKPDKELNQKINSILKAGDKHHLKNKNAGKNIDKEVSRNNLSVTSIIDTLTYNDGSFNSSFSIGGQEWLLQWYIAPADLIFKAMGFYCTSNPDDIIAEAKIVRVLLPVDSLITPSFDWWGYYEALGNGYNDITAFSDNPDITSPWVPSQNGHIEPFGEDMWSDGGIGAPFTPDETLQDYQWIHSNLLFETEIPGGEIFGVAVKNTSPNLGENPISFLSGITNSPGWKFYINGRLDPGVDKGWWKTPYTFDFPVAVDIGSEPLIPLFEDYTILTTTTSTEPRPISAIVTLGLWGHGVPEIMVNVPVSYSTDNGATWNQHIPIYLNHVSDSLYIGELPGFPAGTMVSYYYGATDTIRMLTTVTTNIDYRIFGPSGANTLVVLNGYPETEGYPIDYFFGPDIQSGTSSFDHDTWAYGQPPADLFDNYTNIIEICNSGPEYYLDSLIRPWLAGGNNRNYYLEGQEWLGPRYSFVDTNFVPGDFEFDVLGINESFNDVSYTGTSGQNLPSKLIPQSSTLFGQPLIDRFNTYSPAPDSIQYNPMYVGQLGDANWIDGFNVESDVVVDVLSETRGIAGIPYVQNLPCAMHRTLSNGNKIFFAGYWTFAVNTATNILMPTYHWLGNTNESPAYQALLWFGIPIITYVDNTQNTLPTKFSLDQNYPNPFNPSTKISWQSPVGSWQSLKVYDVLGNEIKTLVDEYRSAGNYDVNFDASQLSCGVYFYRIQAGSFTETQKMVVLK